MNQKEPQAATPVRLDVIQKDPGTLKNKVQGETK
jgi:hypothetical protein